MMITRPQLQELSELQSDIASYYTDSNLVSGETYWTCVMAHAEAKLAEVKGELEYSN